MFEEVVKKNESMASMFAGAKHEDGQFVRLGLLRCVTASVTTPRTSGVLADKRTHKEQQNAIIKGKTSFPASKPSASPEEVPSTAGPSNKKRRQAVARKPPEKDTNIGTSSDEDVLIAPRRKTRTKQNDISQNTQPGTDAEQTQPSSPEKKTRNRSEVSLRVDSLKKKSQLTSLPLGLLPKLLNHEVLQDNTEKFGDAFRDCLVRVHKIENENLIEANQRIRELFQVFMFNQKLTGCRQFLRNRNQHWIWLLF